MLTEVRILSDSQVLEKCGCGIQTLALASVGGAHSLHGCRVGDLHLERQRLLGGYADQQHTHGVGHGDSHLCERFCGSLPRFLIHSNVNHCGRHWLISLRYIVSHAPRRVSARQTRVSAPRLQAEALTTRQPETPRSIRFTEIFLSSYSPRPSRPASSMCSTWQLRKVLCWSGFDNAIEAMPLAARCASIAFQPVLSSATGSVAQYMVLCSQTYCGLALGPPCQDAFTASQMCSTAFWRMMGKLTTDGMKTPQAFEVGVKWLRFTLFERPWDMFFSAMVTPADWWCFSTGRLMNLFTCWVITFAIYERRKCASLAFSPGLISAISI